ncbi:hypothetical protein ACWD46_19510 [Streptomyces sp. NPDC002486]
MIDESRGGRCFLDAHSVEVAEDDGVRIFLSLLDGGDHGGGMAVTLDSVENDDRRILHRIAGLVADLLVIKHSYSDLFCGVRLREPIRQADQGARCRGGGLRGGADDRLGVQRERTGRGIRAGARSLSPTLERTRGGHTTDDATLLPVEWRG